MEITDLTEDDLDDVLEVRNRSFGMLPGDQQDRWRDRRRRAIDEHRSLVVRDAGRAIATAHYIAYRQWWLGRPVDMAGVSGVTVGPEYRGQGVGAELMRAMLERMRAHGYPVSTLFPATVPPYRRVGYELAGRQYLITVPTAALRMRGRPDDSPPKVTRATPQDADRVRELLDGLYRDHRECGSFTQPTVDIADDLARPERFSYLADDGFLSYRWEGSDTLRVDHAVAGSAATARAFWAQVGSGSSTATSVRACVAPDDPLFWLLPDVGTAPDAAEWWMLRLLDTPRAVAGRGFPTSADVDTVMRVTDDDMPGNAGDWRLVVTGGVGELRPYDGTARDPLRTGPRGLAALYAGVPLPTLRRADLVEGGDSDTDARLDTAFAANALARDYF